MKFDELQFSATGCCGGHVQAVADVSADEKLIISEGVAPGRYTVARVVNGLLQGGLMYEQDRDTIDALLVPTQG